ncbi:hypothetical protein [Aeromicrobium sp. IC_218]|uniref:hypothetical protein n=1 Tax=Aeromicrobium sp. IC_218 TaxID=2545468 RepID=UPI00103E61A9|nr:hypothetical protein [Aeromicrobium sp. IC_218]TCI99366.1 hypothetical protein E0W78_06425 [Aeromicrobium sp. IC_218]
MAKKRKVGSPRSIRMMNYAFFDELGQRWDFVRALSRAETEGLISSPTIARTLVNDVAFSTVRALDEQEAHDLMSTMTWGPAPTQLQAALFSRAALSTLVLVVED